MPKGLQAFSEAEIASLVKKLNEKGIAGDWQEPLCSHFMDVKRWGYECIEYLENLVGYELRLIDSETGTDRILYDPERYSKEQAIKYEKLSDN